MGTSITPVREALLKLVSFGALEMVPAHPITIPILNKEKYIENRTIRIASEKRFADAIAHDYSFHIELCKAAAMPALLEIVEILWLKIGPSLNMLNSPAPANVPGSNFHKQIITALEKQDPDVAKTAMEQDLIQGGAALLTYFENQPA